MHKLSDFSQFLAIFVKVYVTKFFSLIEIVYSIVFLITLCPRF